MPRASSWTALVPAGPVGLRNEMAQKLPGRNLLGREWWGEDGGEEVGDFIGEGRCG